MTTDEDIENFARYIKPPLDVLRVNGKIVHNESLIAATCDKKHIHKYYISDIIKKPPVCITCNTGNKISRLILSCVEEVFDQPFIYQATTNEYIEYQNPVYNLSIRSLYNAIAKSDGQHGIIYIPKTTSTVKIYQTLYNNLIKDDNLPNNILNDEQKQRLIEKLHKTPGGKNSDGKKYYKRDKLPYNIDLEAEDITTNGLPQNGVTDDLIQDTDPADGLFCLENCKINFKK